MNNENIGPPGSVDNTRTIARNSLWYGLELLFSLGATFVVSVVVANIVGPVRLGPYQYMVWLTNVTITVGSLGLPATTRRYMAEYLNRGEPGVARATYLTTLKIQSLIAVGTAAVALGLVFWLGEPGYLAPSLLLVAAMIPRIIESIPSMANNAAEVMRRNTGPALIGGGATASLTLFGLLAGWDLVGVAAALVVGNILACGLKLYSVERWLGGVPRGTVSPELKRRMFSYSGQGLALMLLNVLVWDRSDMVILKMMNHDKTQITFFSLAFNLSERILMIPSSFGASLASTMMAQTGRSAERLKQMTVDGARYSLLMALPLLVGVACISRSVVLLWYHEPYRPMITTLSIVALMAIPKVLVAAPTMLLQATERQGFLIACGCVCGAVDIGLDFLLTGRYGANGAAIANGSAQAIAALGIWIYFWRADRVHLGLRDFGRLVLCSVVMAAGVLVFTRAVPGYPGMFGAIAIGAALWMISLRFTGALKPEDASRFTSVSSQVPAAVRPYWNRLIAWLAPTAG